LRIGLHICEDSWLLSGAPCQCLRAAGLDLLLNISASPYHHGKLAQREDVLRQMAQALCTPLAYCNLVGGQDELVFDGASLFLAADGHELARAKQFEEHTLCITVNTAGGAKPALNTALLDVLPLPKLPTEGSDWPAPGQEPVLDDVAEVYAALKLGLRDYVEKNRFREVVVALSGGIDSALVAALAVDALGAARVHGITMPSRFSSSATLGDAQLLAQRLGIECRTLPIKRLHEIFLEELAPCWPGRAPDTTEENLQARIRGNIVMALSNKFGWLVLTTGNKSEIATGYCTLYGDMAGGFAVIKDVPKILVFELSRWRNRQGVAPVIPPSIIERPPTAELRANQKDSDSLPPYDVLDPILERYVERDWPAEKIIAEGYDAATVRRVIKLVDLSEYKRRQGAPGIKITPKAFSRDRRMPITNQYLEHTRV
jgi:NAD+ synthase (glutamine-hydrolysing)